MKRSLFVILVITILTSARGELVESAHAKYSGGTGTAGRPFPLKTVKPQNSGVFFLNFSVAI